MSSHTSWPCETELSVSSSSPWLQDCKDTTALWVSCNQWSYAARLLMHSFYSPMFFHFLPFLPPPNHPDRFHFRDWRKAALTCLHLHLSSLNGPPTLYMLWQPWSPFKLGKTSLKASFKKEILFIIQEQLMFWRQKIKLVATVRLDINTITIWWCLV